MGSSYVLALVAAKRAKQLKEGAPQLVECDSNQSITIALEEILQGKIRPILRPAGMNEDGTLMEDDELITLDGGVALPALDEDSEDLAPSLSSLLGEEEEDHEDEDEEVTADLSVLEEDGAVGEVIDDIALEDDEEAEEGAEGVEGTEISLEEVAEEEEAAAEEDADED